MNTNWDKKETWAKENFIKCPVCSKKYWRHSMKLHIINSGRYEAHKNIMNLLDYAKNKPYEFSPAVMLRQMPHIAFYRRSIKNKKVFTLDV